MRRLFTSFLALAGFAAAASAQAAERPIVVELFTSQGCSSCPPADALLGELAAMPDLLPLAFHVDYWNRLGWKDPFSSPEASARQRAYNASLNLRSVYTPQMVIDGRYDAIGSDRRAVTKAIALATKAPTALPLAMQQSETTIEVTLGTAEGAGSVWLVSFDRQHKTRIGAGENGGRTLTEFNIVRHLEPLGSWDGKPASFAVARDRLGGAEEAAVLVQAADGRMLGAARLTLRPTS